MGLGDDMVEAIERDVWIHRISEALKRHGLKTAPPSASEEVPRFMDEMVAEITRLSGQK